MSTVATELRTPYKGLAPFEDSELDALLFFGRERETEIVAANLLSSRLTVLYGPSGVGKSSLLRAAVARRAREVAPDADVILLDQWAEDPTLPEPDGETFLILDQFEEYFLYHDAADPLVEQLASLLQQRRARVLIAMREDQLARLDAFQAQIPNVFANRLRLGHLDESAARAAIVEPLDRWNAVVPAAARVGIESALVGAVLTQVASAPGQIEAPYLQLVLERVWEQEQAAGSNVLRLDTLDRLGGAEAIVSAHLARALEALPPREAEVATNALRFLVTPSRTKIAHTLDDLVGYTNESPVVLRSVLELLATQRVLRAGDGGRYEIFHDVLAEPVLAWRHEHEAQAALAAAQRRHRRLAVVAGASLALAAAMVGLTVYAFSQRSEAAKQRRIAEAQTEVVLGQKRQAQQTAKRLATLNAVLRVQKQKAQKAQHEAEQAQHEADVSAQQAEASAQVAKDNEEQATASAQAAQVSKEQAQVSEQKAQHSADVARTNLVAARRARRTAQQAQLDYQRQALVEKAEANLMTDPVTSLQAAVKAAGLGSGPAVEDALRDSLIATRVRAIFDGGGGAVNSADISPDGTMAALGTQNGAVRVFDTGTHKLLHELKTTSVRTAAATGVVPVDVVRFSPDGSLLAVGTGKQALLYDPRAGKVTETLPHDGAVLDAVFAGDGRYLITGSADLSTRIWDASSGALLRTITGTAAERQLAVNPAGTQVAVLGNGQAIARVYSVPGGDPVGQVQQPGEVTALKFSPNGAYLVTAGRRNGFVWDAKTLTLVHQLTGHEAPITDIAFAPNGYIVTSSVDSSAREWNPATGESVFTLAGQHQQKILAVAVSPSGNQIATASADNTVRLWKEPLGSTPTLLGGHTDSVVQVEFNRDGSFLLSASSDGFARLWDTGVTQLAPVGAHAAAVTGVAFSADGKTVLSGGGDGTAKLWRGGTALTLAHGGKVVHAVWDGANVLTAGDDGTAKLWRGSDGVLLATYAHGAPVRVALPLGTGVVTFGADGNVKAWTAGGTLLWAQSQGSPLTAGAVSRTGIVASGAADGSIRLWRDGRMLATLRKHTAAVTSLAFNTAGTRLISGGSDSLAYIWSVPGGDLLHPLAGHTLGVTSVSFSPDGTLALTAGADGDMRVWRVKDGKQLPNGRGRLKFHVSTVSQAAFSPDGRWIVSAGPTTAAIWQVRTGRLIYYLNGAKGNLTSAAWAPNSLRIVAGDTGGTVTTFACAICARQPALLAAAKARLAGLR